VFLESQIESPYLQPRLNCFLCKQRYCHIRYSEPLSKHDAEILSRKETPPKNSGRETCDLWTQSWLLRKAGYIHRKYYCLEIVIFYIPDSRFREDPLPYQSIFSPLLGRQARDDKTTISMTSIAASRIAASSLAAKPDTSASHPYTCNTCQVAFRNSELQRGHMRSDWQ
jgi:hypothetical protein